MRPSCLVIRYGEIALKGKVTRRNFEKILRNNMKNALRKYNITFDLQVVHGRIIVHLDDVENGIGVLSHVFGLTSLSPAYEIPTEISAINTTTYEIMRPLIKADRSFALRVTRTGNHSFSSQDVAVSVGSFIQEKTGLSVDLSHPDIEVFIEIREDHSFIFLDKIEGPGGMPLGSQGMMMTIVESPYDLLASWFLLKRGCEMIYVCVDEPKFDMFDSFFSRWHIPKNVQCYPKDDGFWDKIALAVEKYNCQALCSGVFFSDKMNEPLMIISSWKQRVPIPVLTPLISFDEDTINMFCNEMRIT